MPPILPDSAFPLKIVLLCDPEDAHAPFGVATNDWTVFCDGLQNEIEAERVIECLNDLRAAQTEAIDGKSSSTTLCATARESIVNNTDRTLPPVTDPAEELKSLRKQFDGLKEKLQATTDNLLRSEILNQMWAIVKKFEERIPKIPPEK